MLPAMKLDEYLRTNNLDDEAFAAIMGDHSAHAVKKWRYGERTPRADAMRKIQEVTGGQVGPADFFGLPEDASDADRTGAAA
jgi:hypothetical protein